MVARDIPLRLAEFILGPRFARTRGLGTSPTLGEENNSPVSSISSRDTLDRCSLLLNPIYPPTRFDIAGSMPRPRLRSPICV